MRNLKKILALVLALVMSLSLMATAGAADAAATSSETVTPAYETALQVLGKDGLKVFGGYTDGTIRPQNNITRAEVAAILYRIVTGDVTDAQAGIYTDMANVNFNDLTGANWAKGYINYCANAQLIVGVGGNQFKPLANITGYATLAMILRALGYDKNGEFKGSGWEIRTASKARELGILKNVNENQLGSSATRELVAELLFRAMLCDKVQYNALIQDYTSTGVTLGYAVFTLEAVEGIVMANEYADIRRDADGKGYTSPVKVGTSVLRTVENGVTKDRIIDTASTMDDLGETRVAYTIEDKDLKKDTYDNLKKIPLEDPDKDDVEETYDKKDSVNLISTSRVTKDTQYFVNFGEEFESAKTTIKVTYQANKIIDYAYGLNTEAAKTAFLSKYKLSHAEKLDAEATYAGSGYYKMTYTPDAKDTFVAVSDFEAGHYYSIVNRGTADAPEYFYRVEIEPKAEFTTFDQDMVKDIFYTANRLPSAANTSRIVYGEVYKGTQSLKDYSDDYSYEAFMDDCVSVTIEETTLSGNSNGYWLKVIDNDKDGEVDWVFQIRYTVASIATAKDDGTITMEHDAAWTHGSDAVNAPAKFSSTKAMPDETLAAGDVVLYAAIDGVARVWKADYVDVRVSSINRTAKTVTVDGNTEPYTESANHEHSARTDINSGVANMSGTTGTRLYLDKGNYVAAFAQNITGNFVLLTNGWYQNQKHSEDFAVTAWDSTEQKLVQYDVTSGGGLFVDGNITDGAHTWNRIHQFNYVNCDSPYAAAHEDSIHTIVAYMESEGENATLIPVDTIYDVERQNERGYYMLDMDKTIPTSNEVKAGTMQRTAALSAWPYGIRDAEANTRYVRALSDTIYLYVYRDYRNNVYGDNLFVHQITGYANGATWLSPADQAKYVEDVYVVGRESEERTNIGTVDRTFYTANVVVVELNNDFRESHLDTEEVFIYDLSSVGTWATIEEVKAIRADGTDATLKIDLTESRRYTEATGSATGNSTIDYEPGLYYLHRTTRTDSEGIYAIEHMTHEDIRKSGHYDAGVVFTPYDILPSDFVEVRDYICNTGANTLHSHKVANVTPVGEAYANHTRSNTDTSKYYELSYASSGAGTAAPSTASQCLRHYYGDIHTTGNNQNQVLVRFNPVTNQIVYAVSFSHGTDFTESYAQQVWRGVTLDRAKPNTAERYIEISKEAAQVLAEGDTVKLTEAIADIYVDGDKMEKDTVNDKFYDTVTRKSSYDIKVEMNAKWTGAELNVKGITGVSLVSSGAEGSYTLAFLEGNDAKDINIQVSEGSIKPVETEDPALTAAVKAAEEAVADYAAEKKVADLTGDAKTAAEAAKTAFDAAVEAAKKAATTEDAKAALTKAVADYKAAIDELVKPEEPDKNVVNDADITVTAPTVKMGETLPTTVTVAPADKVEVSAVVWKNEAGETVTKAETAGKYTATVTVTAKEGYTLAGGVASIDKTVDVTVEDTTGMVTVTITYVYEDVEMDTQEISVKPSEGKLTLETAKLTTPKIPTTGGLAETKVTAMDNGFTEDAEGNWTLTAETFADMAVKATVVKKDTTPGGGQEWGDLRIAGRPQVLTETEVTATKTIKGTITVESNTTLRKLEQKDQGVFRYTPDTLKVIWNSLERVNDTTWIILATVPADTDNKTVYVEFCPGQMTEDDIALADAKAPALEALRTALKTGEGMPEGFKDLPAEKQAELLDAARENIQNAKTADEVTEAVKNNTDAIEDAISGKTPTTVTLDKTTAELKVGEQVTLTPTVTAEEDVDKTVTWSSSDSAVATVEDGTVTAVAEGTATITAAVGDAKATCTVTVTAVSDELAKAQEEAKTKLENYAKTIEDAFANDDPIVISKIAAALEAAKKAVDAATTPEEAAAAVDAETGKPAIKAAGTTPPTLDEKKTAALESLQAVVDYISKAVTMDTTTKAAFDKEVTSQKEKITKATASTLDSTLTTAYSSVATEAGTDIDGLKGLGVQDVQKAADEFAAANTSKMDKGVEGYIATAVSNARAAINKTVTGWDKLGEIPTIVTERAKALKEGAANLIKAKDAGKADVDDDVINTLTENPKLSDSKKSAVTSAAATARTEITAAETEAKVTEAYEKFTKALANVLNSSDVTVDGGKATVRYHLGKTAAGADEKLTTTMVQNLLKGDGTDEYVVTGAPSVGGATINTTTGEITTTTSTNKVTALNKTNNGLVEVTLIRYYEIYIGDSTEPIKVDESSSNVTVNDVPAGSYVVDDPATPEIESVGVTTTGVNQTAFTVPNTNILTIDSSSSKVFNKDLHLYPGVVATVGTLTAVTVANAIVEVVKTANDTAALANAATEVKTGNVVRTGALLRINPLVTGNGSASEKWALTVKETVGGGVGEDLISAVTGTSYLTADVDESAGKVNKTPAVTYTVADKNITIGFASGVGVKITDINGKTADLGIQNDTGLAALNVKNWGIASGKYIAVGKTGAQNIVVADSAINVAANGTVDDLTSLKTILVDGAINLVPAVSANFDDNTANYKYAIAYSNLDVNGTLQTTSDDTNKLHTGVAKWFPAAATITLTAPTGATATDKVGVTYTADKTEVVEYTTKLDLSKTIDSGSVFGVKVYTESDLSDVAAIDLAEIYTYLNGFQQFNTTDQTVAKVFENYATSENCSWECGSNYKAPVTPTVDLLKTYATNGEVTVNVTITAAPSAGKYFAGKLSITESDAVKVTQNEIVNGKLVIALKITVTEGPAVLDAAGENIITATDSKYTVNAAANDGTKVLILTGKTPVVAAEAGTATEGSADDTVEGYTDWTIKNNPDTEAGNVEFTVR